MTALYNRAATVNIGGREFSYPPFSIEFVQELKFKNPQSTTLKLYNPSPDTVGVFDAKKKGQGRIYPNVTVSAGYKEDYGTVVFGEAFAYTVVQEGLNRILEVKISDKTKDWGTAILNKSYKNVNAESIIRDVCKTLSIAPGEINLGIGKFYESIVLRSFRDSIQKLAKDTNSDFFFKNGLLTIVPSNPSVKTITKLDPSSGLLERPQKTSNGFKIKTLFLYNLTLANVVQINSKEVNVRARITKVNRTFSTFGDAYCEFEVVPI
ncbi:hypothetical protein LEP1GSC058_3102 [Leptospira fainei serovar Hurstbridge str. BUT 6]|uniref:Uncharacterized protein n=1 Tax=Leptospira fainei serovar Hurstbridge str. BUT 6 TaxID=1193011 RepID=S3W031_9LEPT|nr:hypothetical protein [Leptospira fainei]EPG73702.1 hypothetical protein LEP1GSC058_3102 [Leptospira fainei serovar Hurstbridge str. BUT 6]